MVVLCLLESAYVLVPSRYNFSFQCLTMYLVSLLALIVIITVLSDAGIAPSTVVFPIIEYPASGTVVIL